MSYHTSLARSFDSTYEGLKQHEANEQGGGESCFDSTYEGLKLAILYTSLKGVALFRQYL